MFEPKRGMKTQDSYLHGLGENLDHVGVPGRIECVGVDWFVLRTNDGNTIFIKEKDYCFIEDGDFK